MIGIQKDLACGRFGKEEKMLEAVKELGDIILQSENKDRLSIFIENINSNGRYNKCLAIILGEKEEKITYEDLEEEPYDNGKLKKYLYRSGSANGADYSPTAKLTEPQKTFNNKILGWFRILSSKELLDISDEDKNFLAKVKNVLEKNKDNIIKAIKDKKGEMPKKENLFITLKFRNGLDEKYIGEINSFRNLFLKSVDLKDLKIYSKDKVCSICKEKKPIIIGNLNTYAFYTIDKPGFISGGFEEKYAWKNFPVCLDCKMSLEEGKKYIQENLTFSFAGTKYHLIPKFLIGSAESKKEIIDLLRNLKATKLNKDEKNVYFGDEDEILGYIKDDKDNLSLSFLFIRQIKSAERILLLIEDVFPSRLRRIFEAKGKVDEILKGEEQYTSWTLRDFFYKSDDRKKEPDLDRYFFAITERIFKSQKIDKEFLLYFFMKGIRKNFFKDDFFKTQIKKALMNIMFLNELKIIDNKEEIMEEGMFEELFKKYGLTFATPLKRGLFLLGVLAELLLRKQHNDKGTKPFIKNLKSLKMDEKDFKGLLPKIQNKFEEYGTFDQGKRTIAKEAANYLLTAGDDWKMTLDEMNFYFVCGMNLANEVSKIVYKDRKEEE